MLEYCGQRQALPLNLPRQRLQLRTNRLTDKLLRRSNIVSCHSAMGQVYKTIMSLSISPEQSHWLLGDRKTRISKAPSNQVVQSMMSSCPAGGFLADKAVNPTGVNHRAAVTLMRTHRSSPSLKPTATLTASSSNFNPHEGRANTSLRCVEKTQRGRMHCCEESLTRLLPVP